MKVGITARGLFAVLVGCAHPSPPARLVVPPPLAAPGPIDPAVLGAPYLEAVGAIVQRDWAVFLEDLRLRLAPDHALNDGRLVAVLDLEVAADGGITKLVVTTSGAVDFDHAAEELMRDAAPLPPPPPALRSDDGTLHLRWQFARDRRQAGPATASIARALWPVGRAVPMLLDRGDLTEAARRVAAASPADSAGAAQRLFIAALGEALASPDAAVRRAAIDAVGAGHVAALGRGLVDRAQTALDLEERVLAVRALAATGAIDHGPACLAIVRAGLTQPAALTRAAAGAVLALDSPRALDALTLGWLTARDARAIGAALAVLAEVPMAGAVARVRGLIEGQPAAIRAAACTALGPSAGLGVGAWSALIAGADDRDATVRAACLAAMARGTGAPPRATSGRVRAALADRDERVRAAAAQAIAHVAPTRAARDLHPLLRDRSPLVRAAAARAWAPLDGAAAALAPAIADDDPAVRAAAIATLAARPDGAAAVLIAVGDRDPRVRAAAAAGLVDDAALARLAGDDDPAVRSVAVGRAAARVGRERAQAGLAAALAAAPPASLERVRLARAWLMAP